MLYNNNCNNGITIAVIVDKYSKLYVEFEFIEYIVKN